MDIRLENVTVVKNAEHDEPVRILKEVSLDIREKEILCIVGPSGAGKSKLLRTLNRLEEISFGEIYYDGISIYDIPPQQLRRRVGMVLQTPSLFEAAVWENIGYSLKLQGKTENEQKAKAKEMLQVVGLEPELLMRESASLSIGQQQRVSIARTLAGDPEVLLLDEITSALDPHSTKYIENAILDIRRSTGKTFVIVTHSMDLAQRVADRIALLVNGALAEVAETEAFFAKHPDLQVK